jgi:IS605 OrfB family transposase
MRALKNQYSHIFIPKIAVKIKSKSFNIYPTYEVGDIKTKKNLNKITSDFQIRWHRKLDVWHIITSEPIKNKKLDPKTSLCKTVVIDPGIRTFLTCLDSDGNIEEIGKDWYKDDKDTKIKQRIEKMDKCANISLTGKRGQERHNSLKAKRNHDLHRRKLHNMIDDLHKKTSKHLLDNYDVIVLPKLRSKNMLKKHGGLGHINNRHISLLAHCKFHDYITWKAKTRGKIVIDQNEAYTTQTCFKCGLLNQIGASKDYACNGCKNTCDRDIQSCFNIMTRYMSSYSSTILFSDENKVGHQNIPL